MNNFWNLASSACGFLAINTTSKIEQKDNMGGRAKRNVSGFLLESVPSRRVGTGLVKVVWGGCTMGGGGGDSDAAEIWLPQKENRRESHA